MAAALLLARLNRQDRALQQQTATLRVNAWRWLAAHGAGMFEGVFRAVPAISICRACVSIPLSGTNSKCLKTESQQAFTPRGFPD
ncbi:hypothetical protein [Polaromonas sp.]|jgi:hypothetical protein|uniref:hypothetical protein n=1 Tax=Polaromonas sp. TaxID=1869339 RepID=UPI0037C9451A